LFDLCLSNPVPIGYIDEDYVEENKETNMFGDEYAVTTCH